MTLMEEQYEDTLRENERLTRDLTKARVEINNHEKVLAAHVSELEAAQRALRWVVKFLDPNRVKQPDDGEQFEAMMDDVRATARGEGKGC